MTIVEPILYWFLGWGGHYMRLKQSWKKWVILRNWVLGHKTHISNLILIVEQKIRIKRNRQTDRCKRCSFLWLMCKKYHFDSLGCSFFVTHAQKMSFWLIRMLICCDLHKPQLIFLEKCILFAKHTQKYLIFPELLLKKGLFFFAKWGIFYDRHKWAVRIII